MGAVISECGQYRYVLTRDIMHITAPKGDKTVVFIGLNPSTADAKLDDNTIRKCIGFAQRWGMHHLVMLNLFAFRATDPEDMLATEDPIGEENNMHLGQISMAADLVVCAWGRDGSYLNRAEEFLATYHELLKVRLHCLGMNKDGSPKHPLYVPYETPLVRFPENHHGLW